MEHLKSSRNKLNTKDNDINLKLFCVSQTPAYEEGNDTSVYEIDIQSDLEFYNNGRIKTRMEPVGISVAKSSAKHSGTDANKTAAENRDFKNSSIQSCHPGVVETNSEVESSELQTKEENSKHRIEEIKEIVVEKADKENQSPSVEDNSRNQHHLKSYIMENFFSENRSDLKAIFQEYDSKLDNNALHLHHHEHHHHYYFDKSSLSENNSAPDSVAEYLRGAGMGKRCHRETEMPEKPKHDYFCHCAETSDATYKCMNVISNSSGSFENNVSVEKSKENPPSFDHSRTESVELILNKKSDFINSHVYSNVDFSDQPSIQEEEVSKVDDAEGPEKDSKSEYGLLVSSLRDLNQVPEFRMPVIITDQERVPKLSYITCGCTPVVAADKRSCITLDNSETHEETDIERNSYQSEDSTIQTGTNKTNMSDFARRVRFDVWRSKLKMELKQIKKELKRIEEKHSKKKNSSIVPLWGDKQKADSKSTHKIAVYSSKTFIIAPENIYLRRNCECKRLENDLGFLFKKQKIAYKGRQANQLNLCLPEKTVVPKEDGIVSEESHSSYEQIYTNGFCKMSNKILV